MVHPDYSERDAYDADRKLRAKVIIIGVMCAIALWGIAAFVAVSLL